MGRNDRSIYVVDDDPAMRKALDVLFSSHGLSVATFDSGRQFLSAVPRSQNGCIVLDINMPDINGVELQKQLRDSQVELPVVFITGYGDVATAVEAMKQGAQDFIEKPFSNEQLLDCVQRCLETQSSHREEAHTRAEHIQRIERLTRREKQVMDCLVRGLRNKEIANELCISPRTVELHRAKVMEKLQARSLSEVVRAALLAAETTASA